MGYNGGLHNHSCYSNAYLRDSTNQINESIDYAIKLGHRAYALTDHECICGHIKAQTYYQKVKKDHPEFKLILGNEIYLCRNGLNADNYNKDYDYYYHFILLAKDHIGHKQIAELSTRAYKRSYMARGMRRRPTYYNDLFEVIGKNPGHVIGSTACLGGALPKQILKAMSDPTLNNKINTWICQMQKLFGADNFYFEMQPSYNKDQVYVNNWLKTTSKDFDVPYIITTDSHYLKKEDRVVHKAYLKAQNGEREVDDFYATTYMMDTEELESYFNYFSKSELEEAYKNIDNIIDQCQDYVLTKPLKIPLLKWRDVDCGLGYKDRQYLYKKIPALSKFYYSEYKSDRYLVEALLDGIEKHPDLQSQEAYDKINEALEMTWESSEVNKARWSAYYLNLQNIIDECWKAGTIVGPGRGSGVGFILLYALDITQINPLRETTRTEPWRFLNPARVSVLDIDVDIEGGKRAQVLSHLRKVYGSDRVTNVVTFKTETTKSAILTAARGLGIDVDVASYIASLVPADRGMLRSLSQCMYGDEENDMKPIKQFVFEMTENYPELWNVASKIEGLVCGIGMHAGGIIFVDEPFTESTALMRAPDGTLCTQYDLHNCEEVSQRKLRLLNA